MKTQKNSVRRSLILSATALMISVAMLIGTTFAWFTDSVSSGKNKIVAGNLDVELEYLADKESNTWKPVTEDTTLFSDVETGSTTKNLWEPNHTEVAYLRVRNAGTLALNYTLNVTPVDEVGGISAKDGSSFRLSNYLVFGEDKDATGETYADRAAAQAAVAGTEKSLDQNKLQVSDKLSAETTDTPVYKYINLVIYMPSTVGNEANYKTGTTPPSIDFGVTLYAKQAVEEKDSFGNDYDETADLTPDNVGKDNITSDYTPQVNQTATITRNADSNEIEAVEGADLDSTNGTITMTSTAVVDGTPAAKAVVPTSAVAADANEITLSVTKTDKPDGITVESTEGSTALEVKVDGLKTENSDIITVDLFVGKNLQNLKMYHNAVEMKTEGYSTTADTYSYNATTGIVSIAVTSFSPFTAVYDAPVAVVNGTSYTTLSDAVNAIETAGTITLTNDADVSTANLTIPEGKTIVLDLAGHNVKSTNSKTDNIKVNGSLTVRDSNGTGKIYSDTPYVKENADNGVLMAQGQGVFTLESGTIEAVMENAAEKGQFGVTVYDNATINIKGGTIRVGWYAVAGNGNNPGSNTTVNVYGGQLISTADYAIFNPQDGTVNIFGGVVDGMAGGIQMNRGTLNVTGGTVASQGTGDTGTWGDGTGGTNNAAVHLNARYGDVTATIDAGATLIAEGNAVKIATGTEHKTILKGTHPAIQGFVNQ